MTLHIKRQKKWKWKYSRHTLQNASCAFTVYRVTFLSLGTLLNNAIIYLSYKSEFVLLRVFTTCLFSSNNDLFSFTSRYEYKIAREYNWNVKNKASKGYEENYFFIFRDGDGVYYNELETRWEPVEFPMKSILLLLYWELCMRVLQFHYAVCTRQPELRVCGVR